MAPLDRKVFKKPLLAIGVLLCIIIPSLLVALTYTYKPTMRLDNQPRLLLGRSGGRGSGMPQTQTSVLSKDSNPFVAPRDLLGYNSPVSLSNAIVGYTPNLVFIPDVRPSILLWYGVVCPLSSEEADAYERSMREAATEADPAPAWIASRPLYSLDCSKDYPYGFDFTVMTTLPMYRMQQFRMEMWSGRDTPLSTIRTHANLSVVDFTRRELHNGGHASSSSTEQQLASGDSTYSSSIDGSSKALGPSHNKDTSSNYVATTPLTDTVAIKTCDKITDECVQASMFTYTKAYKLMYPQTDSVGYNGRLLAQQTGSDGLWQVSISADLGKLITAVDIVVIAEPAVGTRSMMFRFLMGLVCFATFNLLFVFVKVVGLYARHVDTVRIFSVIDPNHDEIIQEGWEDMRKLGQYCTYQLGEARGRWTAARRRRYRRSATTPNQTDSLTSTSDGSANGRSRSEDNSADDAPLTPTSALAAKAKASQAAAVSMGMIHSYPSSSEEEGDVCRICRVGDPTSDLVAPCACSGTSRYIHRACLEQWRAMTANPEHRRICAECKTEYNVEQQVPQRSTTERVLRVLSPFIKLAVILTSFILFGYVIKVVALLTTQDPFIVWSVNFYHIFIGSLALCSIMIVFSNGLWFVVDFPQTLYQRVPALVFLGIAGPILLGYMAQFWGAIVFETVLTREISFGSGVFTFVAFVNNVLIKLAEVLTTEDAPLPRRPVHLGGADEAHADDPDAAAELEDGANVSGVERGDAAADEFAAVEVREPEQQPSVDASQDPQQVSAAESLSAVQISPVVVEEGPEEPTVQNTMADGLDQNTAIVSLEVEEEEEESR